MKSNNSYILFSLISLMLFSCGNEKQESAADTAPTKALNEAIMLTQEQIDLAGIELTKPRKMIISEYVLSNGNIDLPPQNLISVHAKASGFVKKVNFLPGDLIKKGQLLCVLEHPDYARMQQTFLESIAQRTYLQKEFERKQTLSKSDATSQKSLQQAEADYKIQDAKYKGLKAELTLMGFPAQQIENSGNLQTSLQIYSPADGFISQININQGKLIQPNDLLYQIMDKNHLHIELKVFARDIDKVQEGQQILFKLPESKESMEATVHIVSRMIDPSSNTAIVHGHLVNEKDADKLSPGSYINARIRLGNTEVWGLPAEAIFKEEGKQYVFVKNESQYIPKEINLGATNEDFVEVLGIQPEEEVVVKGVNYLKGMRNEEI